MPLSYDFDIVTGEDGSQWAQFRDAKVVAALLGADADIQEFFAHCGFAFDSFNSGAGPGFYPAEDRETRDIIVERIHENMSGLNLETAGLNGFEFDVFLAQTRDAEPIEMKRSAFRFGLPVDRLIQEYREARPTRVTRVNAPDNKAS